MGKKLWIIERDKREDFTREVNNFLSLNETLSVKFQRNLFYELDRPGEPAPQARHLAESYIAFIVYWEGPQ